MTNIVLVIRMVPHGLASHKKQIFVILLMCLGDEKQSFEDLLFYITQSIRRKVLKSLSGFLFMGKSVV